jgi:hypothetical protein
MPAIQSNVAIGDQDQRRKRLHAASKETQHVQARLIGPVHVLQNHHARRHEQTGDGDGDLMGCRAARQHLEQLTAGSLGHSR